MLEHRARHVLVEQRSLGGGVVGAEQVVAGDGEDDCGHDRGRAETCEQPVTVDASPQAALVHDDRDRRDHEQDRELCACEHRKHETGECERVGALRRLLDGALEHVHGPEKRGIGGGLRQHERREDQPRDEHRQRSGGVRPDMPADESPGDQVRGHRGGRHQDRVQRVCAREPVRHEPVARDRAQQDRVQLVRLRHAHAVQRGQRRARAGHAEREPLVEQLVRHHEPVDDPAGRDREGGRGCGPDHEYRNEVGRAARQLRCSTGWQRKTAGSRWRFRPPCRPAQSRLRAPESLDGAST